MYSSTIHHYKELLLQEKKGVGMMGKNAQLKTLQLGELESLGEHIYGISSWVLN